MEIIYNIKKGLDEEYPFIPTFTIGVQTFRLHPVDTKERAEWYIEMLKTAFKNLEDGKNSNS